MSVLVGEFEISSELPARGREGPFRALRARRLGVHGFARDATVYVAQGPGAAAETALIERARRAVALSHAGILRVLATGRASYDGHEAPYVVYESSEAPPLSLLAPSAEAVPGAVACAIGAAIADVLDHAHRKGVPHGALDAERVLIGADGAVTIAEFALERAGTIAEDLAALAALLGRLARPGEPLGALVGSLAAANASASASADDFSEALSALAFRLSPAPAGRSIGAWVAAARPAAQAAPGYRAIAVLLAGPVEALAPGFDAMEAAGALVDRASGVGVFTDVAEPVEAALALARTLVAGREVGAALALAATGPAARAFDAELARVPPGSAWLTAELVEEARAAFLFSPVGDGRRIFAAAGERAVATAGRFVGRSAELARLARALGEAEAGGPVRLTVSGPAGIGKTRLLAELVRRAKRGGVRAHLLRVGNVAPAPFGVAEALLVELGGSAPDAVGAASVAYVLEGVARDGPVIVAIDDLALADPESRELIDAAAGLLAPGTRLLLVDAARGEAEAGTNVFAIGELPDDEIAQLVAARLGARIVPPELFEPLVARTGGHPLYVEEALRELVEQALVEVDRGLAVLRPGAEVRLPASLEALARARVAALSPLTLRVLRAAGVSGPGAKPDRIATIAGLPPDSASEIVWQLVDGGFARLDEVGGLHLASLHRDAVLDAMTRDEVVALHLAAAGALGGEASAADLAARADHLERAGDEREAARVRAAAARALVATGALAPAAAELVRALGALDAPLEVEAAIEDLARIRAGSGIRVDVEPALAHAIEIIDTAAAEPVRAVARVRLARMLPNAPESAWVLLDTAETMSFADHDTELARARVAVARAATTPLPGLESARLLAAGAERDAGALEDAAAVAVVAGERELARALLDRLGDTPVSARRLRGELAALEGDDPEAERLLHLACERAREADAQDELARARLALGELYGRRGDDGRSFAAFTEAARAARAAGSVDLAELAVLHLDALAAAHDPAPRWLQRSPGRCPPRRPCARPSTSGTLLSSRESVAPRRRVEARRDRGR